MHPLFTHRQKVIGQKFVDTSLNTVGDGKVTSNCSAPSFLDKDVHSWFGNINCLVNWHGKVPISLPKFKRKKLPYIKIINAVSSSLAHTKIYRWIFNFVEVISAWFTDVWVKSRLPTWIQNFKIIHEENRFSLLKLLISWNICRRMFTFATLIIVDRKLGEIPAEVITQQVQ